MQDRRIDNVLDMILELNDIAKTKNINDYDAIRCFNANCATYDYTPNSVKQLYSKWDYALCQTNLVLESKINYARRG